MARFALVEPSGRVAQVEDAAFPVAEPFQWIECDKNIDTNYNFIDGVFVARTDDDPAA